MASKSYFVVNIMEYLCDAPMEEILLDLCSLYECPLNRDVESFLKKSAVDFAKKHQAVSYLVFSQKNGAFLGYFSLAIKTISVKAQNVSRTVATLPLMGCGFCVRGGCPKGREGRLSNALGPLGGKIAA
ncbi:hypothetical protein IKQ19_18120 [Candidatus Saccharibacteria bacterium]|nr:hypothetical protein [Candidatus Saccharibacteria bacterium]